MARTPIIWNNEVIDDLHFSWDYIFGYDKTWNFVIGERESGKSVNSWMKIYNAFYFRNQPSLVIRRQMADITSVYLGDTEKVLNKFLLPENQIRLYFLKGDIEHGVGDVRVGSASEFLSSQAKIKALPVLFRVAALSTPMSRLKSNVLTDTAYFFFDEFIANTIGGEKYLSGDEHFLIQELYTTYNRESKKRIKIIACGNPYSIYNPIFSALGVDSGRLKPGAFISEKDYAIDCFQVPDELKKLILAKNPMYQFDETYKRYAFGGEAINDANIRIHKTEPKGFKLRWVFKIGNDYLSIHQGSGSFDDEQASRRTQAPHTKKPSSTHEETVRALQNQPFSQANICSKIRTQEPHTEAKRSNAKGPRSLIIKQPGPFL